MRIEIVFAGLLCTAFFVAAPSAGLAQAPAAGKGKMKAMGRPNAAVTKELKGGAKVELKAVPEPEAAGKPEADLPEKKGKGKGKGMKEAVPEVDGRAAAVRARREAWKADPEGHKKLMRSEQQAKLKAVLGVLVADPAVREELARHARRMAKLDWAEETAVEKNDTAALARIDTLRAKEIARHEKWMSTKTAKPAAGTDEGAAQ